MTSFPSQRLGLLGVLWITLFGQNRFRTVRALTANPPTPNALVGGVLARVDRRHGNIEIWRWKLDQLIQHGWLGAGRCFTYSEYLCLSVPALRHSSRLYEGPLPRFGGQVLWDSRESDWNGRNANRLYCTGGPVLVLPLTYHYWGYCISWIIWNCKLHANLEVYDWIFAFLDLANAVSIHCPLLYVLPHMGYPISDHTPRLEYFDSFLLLHALLPCLPLLALAQRCATDHIAQCICHPLDPLMYLSLMQTHH